MVLKMSSACDGDGEGQDALVNSVTIRKKKIFPGNDIAQEILAIITGNNMKERRKSRNEDHSKISQTSEDHKQKSDVAHKGAGHERRRQDSIHKPEADHDVPHRRRLDSVHRPDQHLKTGSASSHFRPRAGTLTYKDAHSIASSKGHHDKKSVATSEDLNQPQLVKYENTFKLEPDKTFMVTPVKNIMKEVIESEFTMKNYDSIAMSKLCVLASDMIKEKIKKQIELPRFKIVCSVLIGEKPETTTSLMVTSRCLWDQRFDNQATVTIQKESYVIVATVFALYAE